MSRDEISARGEHRPDEAEEQPPPPAIEEAADASRRTFLAYLGAAFSAFLGFAFGLPVISYLAAPLARKETATWLSLGKLDAFTPGEPKLVPVSISRQDGWRQASEARMCWVVASDSGEFTVYNGRCTHLGCAYSWRTDGPHAGTFFCPCHDGVFAPDGAVVGGPPPRALDRFAVHVDGDELLVLYQDFRLGVPHQEAT